MKKSIAISYLGSERRINNNEYRNIGGAIVDLLTTLARDYESVTVFTDLGTQSNALWAAATLEAARIYENIKLVGVVIAVGNGNYWEGQWRLKSRCSSVRKVGHSMADVYEYMSEKSDMVVRYRSEKTPWLDYSRKGGKSIITLFP